MTGAPTITAVICGNEARTDDIHILTLAPQTPFSYRAGQYVEILLPHHEPRAFSIANAPRGDGRIVLHIRNTGRGTGAALCASKTGDHIAMRGPLGTLDAQKAAAKPVVMIAGGTGLAPVLALAQDILRRGLTESGIRIIHGARHDGDLYARPEIDALLSTGDVTFVTATGDETPLHVLARLGDDLAGHAVYLCGPDPMVHAARKALLSGGVAAADIHTDTIIHPHA